MTFESVSNYEPGNAEPERVPRRARGPRALLSWWLVWLPVIVVIILWIGGWGFGNYGGPWSPKPRSVQPQISDPSVVSLDFQRTPARSSAAALVNAQRAYGRNLRSGGC